MKNIITVGISCVGSGVGQSVISSLNLSRLPIKKIGLGNNPFAFGMYDCDDYAPTPSVYSKQYTDDLITVCKNRNIDIVIPGLDDEVLFLSQCIDKFSNSNIKVLCSPERLVRICRNKKQMVLELSGVEDAFVRSFYPGEVARALKERLITFPLIAKPLGGFASRGVHILLEEKDLEFLEQGHVVQELAVPHSDDPNYDTYLKQISNKINPQLAEISVQLLFSRTGNPLGRLATYNKLNNGVPIEIIPFENEHVWSIVDALIPPLKKLGLQGPLNLQGRLTDKGFKIFEMNPRFTGITGLRALMGFNEVEACIKEWMDLGNPAASLVFHRGKFGIRQTLERTIPINNNPDVKNLFKSLHNIAKPNPKVLLLTGATGFIGRNLLERLQQDKLFDVWLLGRDRQSLKKLRNGCVSKTFHFDDIITGGIPWGRIDIFLHLAFSRPDKGPASIAESVKLSMELFTLAASHHTPLIVNLSSQSVYGIQLPVPREIDIKPSPRTLYGQAKWATEVFLQSIRTLYPQLMITSLRLETVSGNNFATSEVDFISKMIKQALTGSKLSVFNAAQMVERIDIEDVVSALITLLKNEKKNILPAYNLGAMNPTLISDVAKTISTEVSLATGKSRVPIVIDSESIECTPVGLNSHPFMDEFDWKPARTLAESIRTMVRNLSTLEPFIKTGQSNDL